MTRRELIKEGFRVINRNLPLVLIQIGVMVISFLAFIFLVGIPVAIGIIYLGIDLVRFKDVISDLKDPIEILSQYSGLAIFLVTSFALYLTAVTCLALFVFGGNMAVIKDSIKDPSVKFSFKKFLVEGKRYFLPLCWLALILGIFFLIFIFVLGIFVGAAIVLLAPYKDDIGIFLIVIAILSGIILLLIALIGFLLLLALSLYAVIALVVDELKAWKAIKRAVSFMREHFLESIGFYLLLIAGYIGAVLLIMLVNFPFSMIPVIGPILNLPLQLVTYIIQIYLGLVMMASLIVFYVRKSASSPQSSPLGGKGGEGDSQRFKIEGD